MRVGMDISQTAYTSGVGVYTENLANKLVLNPALEMVYFYSSLRIPYRGELTNVKKYSLPPTLFELLFNRIRNVSIERFIGPIDIFHSSDWVQPPTRAKKVTTYHDLIPLLYPQWSDPKIVSVHRRRLKLVEKEIDMVIAVSENTKRDLSNLSEIPESKIVVIYEGVEDFFKPQKSEDIAKFKKEYNLPERFILAVGGVGTRKNISLIKEATRDQHLVILGQDINVQRIKLPLLYASADLLVYIPLYEGFGLPVLEAMACGVPVLCSNTSSLPEVGGKAVEYVNPQDLPGVGKKIRLLLNDKDKISELKREGLKQASNFSWQKCAQETANVYKKILS